MMCTDYENTVRECEQTEARAAVAQLDEQIVETQAALDHARYRAGQAEARRDALAAELAHAHDRNDGDRFRDLAPRHADAVTDAGQSWAPVHAAERLLARLRRYRDQAAERCGEPEPAA